MWPLWSESFGSLLWCVWCGTHSGICLLISVSSSLLSFSHSCAAVPASPLSSEGLVGAQWLLALEICVESASVEGPLWVAMPGLCRQNVGRVKLIPGVCNWVFPSLLASVLDMLSFSQVSYGDFRDLRDLICEAGRALRPVVETRVELSRGL